MVLDFTVVVLVHPCVYYLLPPRLRFALLVTLYTRFAARLHARALRFTHGSAIALCILQFVADADYALLRCAHALPAYVGSRIARVTLRARYSVYV